MERTGRGLHGMQKKAEAIAAFNKLLEINPYDEYANSGIGYAYVMDRNYAKAAAFRKQVEMNPLDSNANSAWRTL